MNTTAPTQISHPARHLGAGSLALVLTAASALTLVAAPGADRRAAPPDFPDEVHVMNGCFISTAVYVAKFLASFPTERALPLTVRPPNYEGPHTIALLTWEGRWWARDEYFGVFMLPCSVAARLTLEEMGVLAGRALEGHSTSRIRADDLDLEETRRRVSVSQRVHEIAAAVSLLPFATEIFWARSGREEIPFIFFRPAEGQIAVYDPLTGTSSASCACADSARVVTHVAARIGYRVDSLHREPAAPPASAVMASTEASHGGPTR